MIKNFFKNHPMHQKFVSYLDFIYLLKLPYFFLVWVLICIGMYIGQTTIELYPQWLSGFDFKTLLLFLSLSLMFCSIFITITTSNKKDKNYNNINIDSILIERVSKVFIYLSFFLFLFLNFYNLLLAIILYTFFKLIYLESVEKKDSLNKILFDWIFGVLLTLSGFVFIATNNSYLNLDLNSLSLFRIVIYSLCILSILIIINIQNCLNDDVNQLFKRFIATILITLSFGLGIYFIDPLLSICSMVSLPFFIYALFRNLDKDITRAIRYPVFIFNFFISTIYPYLSIALILIFYISKYYNWHRLNIHYPTFLVNND